MLIVCQSFSDAMSQKKCENCHLQMALFDEYHTLLGHTAELLLGLVILMWTTPVRFVGLGVQTCRARGNFVDLCVTLNAS